MTGRRLTALVFLAACSMVLQYAAQGALAAGFNPREFGAWFWYADAVLWGLRALIDAAVIVSLFQTQARNSRDARLLAVFEVAMIGLITLTVGPAMVAIARGVAIDAVLSQGLRWAWSFEMFRSRCGRKARATPMRSSCRGPGWPAGTPICALRRRGFGRSNRREKGSLLPFFKSRRVCFGGMHESYALRAWFPRVARGD